MNLRDLMQWAQNVLRQAGLSEPLTEMEILFSAELGCSRPQLLARDLEPLSSEQRNSLEEKVLRRAAGEPMAYILGFRDFYKSRFSVGPGVLIPRPETELLVEESLALFPEIDANLRIADLGCGSGCIGLSLLLERPQATLLAVDCEESALGYAKKNAEELNLTQRSQFLLGRVEELEVRNSFDLVVANPPYIDPEDERVMAEVKVHEPGKALFAEGNGLDSIRSWLEVGKGMLKAGGIMLVEIGIGQADALRKESANQTDLQLEAVHLDLAGIERMLVYRKASLL